MSGANVLVALSVLGLLPLADPSRGEKTKPQGGPDAYEVSLADGSVVKVRLLTPEIEIVTRYGTLKVPMTDVRRIDVGFRYPEGVEKRVEEAVTQLGSADFRKREAASTELLRLKELAYPAVKRALKSDDPEVKRRATEVVKELEERVPSDKLEMRDEDVVVTSRFPIAGRIKSPALKGRTPVFGEFQLQWADARQVRSTTTGNETEISVDAGRFAAITQEEWLETSLNVEKGETIRLRASGTINLNPQQGNFPSGPEGSSQFGMVPGAAGRFMAGTLVGRIGRRGSQFKVGAQYEEKAKQAGRLYLRIAPSHWGQQASGSYTVTASTELDVGGLLNESTGSVRPVESPPATGIERPPVPIRSTPRIPGRAIEKKEVSK